MPLAGRFRGSLREPAPIIQFTGSRLFLAQRSAIKLCSTKFHYSGVLFIDSIQASVVVTSAENLGQIDLIEISFAATSKAAVASVLPSLN